MKTKLKLFKGKVANSLLVTLFMMCILAVSIAGYLSYVEQQNRLSARAQYWNMAMAISESGIEEGLEALNSYPNTDCPPDTWFTGNNNNWTAVGTHVFTMSRTNSYGYYIVTNDLSQCTLPVITSRAFVTPPAVASGRRLFFFAAATTATTAPTITRAVQVHTYKDTIWKASLAARHSVSMSGGSDTALVNSFDDTQNGGVYNPANALSNAVVASLDGTVNVGNWTIDGHISVSPTGSAYVGPNGTVTGGTSYDANFNLPNPTVPDYSLWAPPPIPGNQVITQVSPGTNTATTCTLSLSAGQTAVTNITYATNYAGSCSYTTISSYTNSSIVSSNPVVTTNSSVVCTQTNTTPVKLNQVPAIACTVTPVNSGNGNINYNWTVPTSTNHTYTTNWSYTYQTNNFYVDVVTNYTIYSGAVYQTNGYAHVICGDYYITSASDLSGSSIVTCPSRIVAVNGISLHGQDQILIAPGGTLTMYSEGSVDLGGNGMINTNSGSAENFSLVCPTNVTSVSISGNGQFCGTVLAPGATVTLNGGGNSSYDVIGAIMANDIVMHGHMSFHFPESLYKSPSALRYIVSSWHELQN